MKFFRFFLKICFVFLFLFIIINFIGIIYGYTSNKIDIKTANTFYLYDSKESLVFKSNGNEKWISLDDMNSYVIDATIAVEDKNFYEHNGFDFLRIFKAIIENIRAGEIVQGASTITQQYAKNLFLDFGQSWERKWKEMWITFQLEQQYDKNNILEGYLNTINYGNGNYGIGSASSYYFDKDVSELSLAEASILAGIPNSPSNYSPLSNYSLSKTRQKVVLSRMVDNNFITKEEADIAYNEELTFYGEMKNEELSSLLYFQDAVMQELETISAIPESYLDTGGLKIYTTLDIQAQKALESGVKKNQINGEIEVAKVMMNPNNGNILGLIGGINYKKSQFNRATMSLRQPGSTIKPFLYYDALLNGFTASTTFLSQQTTFHFDNGNTYSPSNSGNIYGNQDISLAAAIAYSDNIYAVKTHLFLGEENLVDILRKVGITSNLDSSPSLPLGSYEVNIIELTKAYGILANGGKNIDAHFIEKIEDIEGNILYQYEKEEEIILDPVYTFLISELLTTSYDRSLIDFANPTCIRMISDLTHKYALKSGSTDTDAWVVGYTPDIVLASWAGYDVNKPIENEIVSSNKTSWAISIEEYLKNKESNWYDIPDNVRGVLVNPLNGKVATNESKHKKILYYLEGTEPVIKDEIKVEERSIMKNE